MKYSVFTTAMIMTNFASAYTSMTQQLRELEQNEDDTLLHDESRNTDGGQSERDFTDPSEEVGSSPSGVGADEGAKKGAVQLSISIISAASIIALSMN